ncbi:hypothetical protein GCM10011375_26580 [Hymenobacter qilianensis]|uniref:Uncharacterized protein n=2 Tax=Hymenobacter qilianensis TaxID=1385715 RepID=A0ACB5PTG1_9BACT|nr:hypothetical protein H9L05_03005 [Hymenobacter qilianensis]GGF70200.1 hypothetical protein GCM10011375_26580 [Hymenobacter qilianensis]
MPDHIHGILIFDKLSEATSGLSYQNKFGPQRENLAAVLRGFKAGVSSWARSKNLDFKWQAGFHDRVIRNENELEKIRHYIATNPSRWEQEQLKEENSI